MKDERHLDMDMDAWAEKIDALVAGEHVPSDHNDDLLDLASRLNTALTPYLDMRRDAEQHISNSSLRGKICQGAQDGRPQGSPPSPTTTPAPTIHGHATHSWYSRGEGGAGWMGGPLWSPVWPHPKLPGKKQSSIQSFWPRPNFSHRLLRPALLVVALVCCLLLLLGNGAFISMRSGIAQLWHTSTSLDQLQGVSVDSLERPRNGIRPLPLLPTTLPADIQGASYGVITDASNPNVLVTFVASYHLKGQDMLLYEQPSAVAFPAANAQTVQIGAIQGQLFQDDAGTNALQWYQHGMICQLTGKLPVERLISLASTFQQIKTWELIL